MTTDNDRRFRHLEKKVGLFVGLALFGCLAVLLFLAVQSDLFTPKLRLQFTVDKSIGFSRGMPVRLSGFRIGRLDSLALNAEARVDVGILIDRRYQQWLREDSVVRLAKEGLVGEAFLEVTPGRSTSPMLADGDRIEYLAARSLDEHLDELSGRVLPVLDNVRTLLEYASDPEGDIRQTLANVRALSEEARATRAAVDRLLASADHSVTSVTRRSESLIGELEGTLGRVDRIVGILEQRLPGLLDKSDATLANVQRTSAEVSLLAEELAPQVGPLVERTDELVRDSNRLVESIQEIWLFRPAPQEAGLPLLPGGSHE